MHNKSFFLRYRLHHVLGWLLLMGIWYYLRYQDYSRQETAFQITLVKVIDLAILFYVTNYVLLPALLYKRKYFLFFLAFFILVVTSSLIKMNIIGEILNAREHFSLRGNLKARIYDNVLPHFFLVIAGACFKLMYDYGKMQKRMAEMAREKAVAELNFLKSQINPHFLFNSLNSVYFLINKDNQNAREALHKFSDMLRYQLYECVGDRIPIEKEMAYLKDYVHLQKLRREHRDKVEFSCSPQLGGFSIQPLLLIPFVENSFKHLSSFTNGRENRVLIEANRANGEFHFRVSNTVDAAHPSELPGGIGLNNVKRRLELLYPNRHRLELKNSGEEFTADLFITINREDEITMPDHR